MKRVLIISPHFPPVNAADMQRVRISLPYFKDNGWEPTVIAVKPEFVEAPLEENLLLTIPSDVAVHRVGAFSSSYTRKFGLGNLGLRSLIQIFLKSIKLIQIEKYDLIYFSTTAFPVMVLGRIFKIFFKIPFVLDIQDPWRQDFYLDKPKHEQPPKFKFAYKIDSFLERATVPFADGLIAVSEGYINTFHKRYPATIHSVSKTITFGASEIDFKILDEVPFKNKFFDPSNGNINLLYIGRGGYDLHYSLKILFNAIAKGIENNLNLFSKIRIHFIGTSYAKNGTGIKTIEPLANQFGLQDIVTEVTDRIPYFETLKLLKEADLLVIPGSTDINYTASKLYPYILSKKNLLTIFHEQSSVNEIIKQTNSGKAVTFNVVNDNIITLTNEIIFNLDYLIRKRNVSPEVDWHRFKFYTAQYMTLRQTAVFDNVLLNTIKS